MGIGLLQCSNASGEEEGHMTKACTEPCYSVFRACAFVTQGTHYHTTLLCSFTQTILFAQTQVYLWVCFHAGGKHARTNPTLIYEYSYATRHTFLTGMVRIRAVVPVRKPAVI